MASSSMDKDPEKKRSGGAWLAVVVMLPVLYVLSFGLVGKFIERNKAPWLLQQIYSPVRWSYENVPWTKKPIEAYGRFWGFH
ncbi:MAG: hypothetical protein ABIS50_15685 [Luteolibacter sp.]|uniref:hypothetical protein n=1 Tax=Luteolibacter sp. TaxID=1962973 RepID=UPI00326514F8